jgi:hypothetical protein
MTRLLPAALAAPLLTLAASAHAHPGHGLTASWHWHASDAWGFLAVAALAALAIWLSRGD